MRQLVTQNVSAVDRTQNADPHRRRSDNLAVELLVLFKALGVGFCRNKDFAFVHPREGKEGNPHQHVQ